MKLIDSILAVNCHKHGKGSRKEGTEVVKKVQPEKPVYSVSAVKAYSPVKPARVRLLGPTRKWLLELCQVLQPGPNSTCSVRPPILQTLILSSCAHVSFPNMLNSPSSVKITVLPSLSLNPQPYTSLLPAFSNKLSRYI